MKFSKGEQMNIYGSFAELYDLFMQDMPYDAWVDYMERLFRRYGKSLRLLLELGCGTGNVTMRLADKGYDMIGLDISTEMLNIARQKNDSILYLAQDMREFELYGTVDCILCLCDSLNYILEDGDLLKVFSLAENYLNPGGLLIFDVNTQYKFEKVLGDSTFAENREGASFIWENCYYADEKINEYCMTFFAEDADSGLYKKFEETHQERAYSIDEIKEVIEGSGLIFADVFDECTFDPPREKSERIYFVAQKQENI